MPSPRPDESKDEFIERCMGDDEAVSDFPDEDQRFAFCNSEWEGRDDNSVTSSFVIQEFASVQPGDPIRLFPFGRIVKGGEERVITPELAHQFKLPDFKPPIKLGSHKDETPAGAFINDLFVGEDGLYANVEFTEKGRRALEEGDFRYHSPEVIWEDGVLERANGELIEGPIILGDALLHTPHLGEAAALFTVEPMEKGDEDMPETVAVPKDMWESVLGIFQRDPEPEPEPEIDPEEYSALQAKAQKYEQEAEEYEARLTAIQEQEARAERVSHFEAELEEVDAVAEDEDLAELLADLPEEQAEGVLTKIKALAEQVNMTALEEERGSDGAGEAASTPIEQLHNRIDAIRKEEDVSYREAASQLRDAEPELFEAAYGRKGA